jgi:phosphoribosylamine--glycine ligase
VFLPVLNTMSADGNPYVGFLYAGLMLTETGPKVIEFNARLGDPETQAVLPRLQSDLVDLIETALAGNVQKATVEWSDRFAVNVVIAARGYPDEPRSGDRITGLPPMTDDLMVFHAGTARDAQGRLVASGGRVLSVVGLGDTAVEANVRAYDAARAISLAGRQFRTDIAG